MKQRACKIHPLCLLLPEMDADQYQLLLKSVSERGVRQDVVMLDGMILDGRHRYKAAVELGLPCPAREYDPMTDGDSPAQFVMDANVHRRSLTPSQRAQIAVEVLPYFEAEAAKRKGNRKKPEADDPDKSAALRSEKGKAAEKAAKATGATPRMVEAAKAVNKAAPELGEQIKAGKLTVGKAKKIVDAPPPPPPPPEVPPEVTKASLAIEQASVFAELIARTHKLRHDIEALAATSAGAELRIKQITAHLQSVVAAVRFAVPARPCPYMPACGSSGCKTCSGREWITEEIWDRLPPEMKS